MTDRSRQTDIQQMDGICTDDRCTGKQIVSYSQYIDQRDKKKIDKCSDRQTYKWTEGQYVCRQVGGQTDRERDSLTDRERQDRQTDRKPNRQMQN